MKTAMMIAAPFVIAACVWAGRRVAQAGDADRAAVWAATAVLFAVGFGLQIGLTQ